MKALFFGKSAISIQEVPVSYRVNGVRESSMILFFRKIAHRHQLTLYLNALTGKGRPLQGVYIRKISLRNLTFFHTYIMKPDKSCVRRQPFRTCAMCIWYVPKHTFSKQRIRLWWTKKTISLVHKDCGLSFHTLFNWKKGKDKRQRRKLIAEVDHVAINLLSAAFSQIQSISLREKNDLACKKIKMPFFWCIFLTFLQKGVLLGLPLSEP